MPTSTSELSNALNPYASQGRQRIAQNDYSQSLNHTSYQPLVQPLHQPHVPHVSELQMAIAEPAPVVLPVEPIQTPTITPRSVAVSTPSAKSRQGAHIVAELFRKIAAIQNAQDSEVKRRLAWEKEQQEKEVQRKVEAEKTITEMQDELQKLRSMIESRNSDRLSGNELSVPQETTSPGIPSPNQNVQPASPISPMSQTMVYSGPAFVQGSSRNPLPATNTSPTHTSGSTTQVATPPSANTQTSTIVTSTVTPIQSITPDPSPHLPPTVTPKHIQHPKPRPEKRKKRRKTYESDGASSTRSSSSTSSSISVRPRKRVSHHDTSCYTIHHAIRLHILRMMDQETDKELPDTHVEGTPFDPSDPVRFVWDKTSKQSVHNSRMKKRILDDIKENRRLYKDVPQNEFTKKNMDSAFDQCFVTFRQKFKAQRDTVTAAHHKQREEAKARRSRHISRRKIKLNNRSEARNKIEKFEHVTFDGALNNECMSSEESDREVDPLSPLPSSYLTTHGYAWRSSRLLRFFDVLDDEDKNESSTKPKRGQGRKERRVGPNKEEFILPPAGVSTWMISRRWCKASLTTHPDLPNTLSKLIVDPVGFDWSHFHELGEESGDDDLDQDPGTFMSSEFLEEPQVGNFYRGRAKDYIELHDQVQTSVSLLDNLESFLSTFQKDLAAVAGQISELQDRSKDIDSRLKTRKRIERPLSSLLSEITIPPTLAATILDTNVGEPWIDAIADLERRIITTKARTRVKAARDLGEVVEGLRIVAATKLRNFFLALLVPIRSSVTTNMQVIQTSVLLKYNSLFGFLQRQAPQVSAELQRAYVGAARLYYETGFRRYARSLSVIKIRTVEKFETVVNIQSEANVDLERLQHGKIDGPGVTLAFMADDKLHKEHVEALLRSLILVFMDNSTAEYSFVSTFFASQKLSPPVDPPHFPTAGSILSPDGGTFTELQSPSDSEFDAPRPMSSTTPGLGGFVSFVAKSREEQAAIDNIWKQVMDPVMEYCTAFVRSILDPIPPVIPLLTMIRLAEDSVAEIQKRHCPPAETYVFGLSLQMWPVFQKGMTEHVESLKKLADGSGSGYFSRSSSTTTDARVEKICGQYVVFFNSFVFLTDNETENMIFTNLLRLRQQVAELIIRHTTQMSDTLTRAKEQSKFYRVLLQGLSKGTHHTAHLKLQQEIAHWGYLEEETKRKMTSTGQSRGR